MNIEEQRKLGVRLAKEAGATKTLEIIKDTDKCFDEIFKAAADEVGADKLASIILENDAEWSFQALRALPEGFGDASQKLVDKSACLLEKSVIFEPVENAAADVFQANHLQLKLIPGAAFECYFSMMWKGKDGQVYPTAVEADSNKWNWSIKMSVNNSSYNMPCEDFAKNANFTAPLEDGDSCWMIVLINGGGFYQLAQFSFNYSSTSNGERDIVTWGAMTNPQFDLRPKAKAV